MRILRKNYYTTDNSDLYWSFVPKYKNETYVKCKIILYYKYGEYKGTPVEIKNYKLEHKNIQHWKIYTGAL